MPSVAGPHSPFGDVDADAATVFHLPEGLMGFHGVHEFAVIDSRIAGSPFKCMVSKEQPDIGFAIADPSQLFSDYEVDLAVEAEVLDIGEDDPRALFVILTIQDEQIRTTANLLAPLLVNLRTGLGRQLVLSESRYSTRHPIIAPRQAK